MAKCLDDILVAKNFKKIASNQNLEGLETSTLLRPPHYQQILTFLASTTKMANAAIGGFFTSTSLIGRFSSDLFL